jgi:hypothetical protein
VFLSELFGGIEGEPVQVELSGVRILFELLGFLLNVKGICGPARPDLGADTVYNGRGFNFLFMIRRTRWNAKLAQCGRAD